MAVRVKVRRKDQPIKKAMIRIMENKAQREQKRDLKMNRSLMTHNTSNDHIYI